MRWKEPDGRCPCGGFVWRDSLGWQVVVVAALLVLLAADPGRAATTQTVDTYTDDASTVTTLRYAMHMPPIRPATSSGFDALDVRLMMLKVTLDKWQPLHHNPGHPEYQLHRRARSDDRL
ncbi:MAG: hypothetical protein AB9872_04370 [Solidesulfovibrio sp.]